MSKKKVGIVEADVVKRFGVGAWITGDQLKSAETIHVSPKLDLILGGGIPGGSVVTLAGDPKCGKTVTALHILAKAQAAGRETFFINIEGRIKERDLDGIRGLDKSKLVIVRSYRDEETGKTHVFKADEFLDVTEKIIHNHPGAVIVMDSISQLVTTGEMTNDIATKDRAPGATLMAKFCRRLANTIPVNDTILIGILHFIANTSGYGKAKVKSGGRKIQYAMDIGLECKTFKIVREGQENKKDGKEDNSAARPIGQDVTWITTSTAFAPPGQVATSRIMFGMGIDELFEMMELAEELGLIEKAGAWWKLTYMEDYVEGEFVLKNFTEQGKEKMSNRLRANEHERACLEAAFREMVGLSE